MLLHFGVFLLYFSPKKFIKYQYLILLPRRKGIKMQKNNLTQTPENHNSIKCPVCNDEFYEPLYAAVTSGCLVEEYYACPRCLSKITTIETNTTTKPPGAEEAKQEQATTQEPEIEEKNEEITVCLYQLGYLKQRPKNTPIPEECFTCPKMIECMK